MTVYAAAGWAGTFLFLPPRVRKRSSFANLKFRSRYRYRGEEEEEEQEEEEEEK